MLGGESSSSSSNNASSSSQWTFHVFLSFRGGDTRFDFTDHLYAGLLRKGIITFRDDIQLEKGDVISQELLKAIEQSLASIVVLSQNYASSTWCLDELQKILESRKLLGREVIPVFYGVTPCDVKELTKGFAEAFKKHETRFSKEKVQKWRDSLIEVAGIPGWESNDKREVELIENIAASVWTKLRPKLPSYNDGLVGVDSRVKKVYSLLRMEESNQVCFIGIWGMGGIGKTTIARVVFNQLRDQFGISCFLENVREISGERDGMLSLQSKLLSHLEIKGLEIKDLDEGKNTIRNLLFKKKVLLVIDDVDDISQLECLAERQEWFGLGSRVIVTTRDTQVLISHGTVENYEIDILNQYESLQLLSQKAFKRDQPQDNYMELSERVVKYAAGLPLALKLLGTFLCGRSLSQWKEVVEKIKEVPPNDIVKKSLRISYNGLPVRYQTLFLDIACFFKGRVKELVIQALDICERYPPIGIDVLIEKSLATCDDGMHLVMHDLLQEAGRDIVNEECPIDASRRSRLWSMDDIDDILKHNKATESIQGLILYPQTKPYEAFWDPEAFSKMCSLKLILIFHDIQLPHGLKCLCTSLKFLQWGNFPLEALPLGVPLDEVVELKLRYSKIKKIWSGTQIEEERKVWFIMPGSEIPSWFENQNYHLLIDPSDPPYNTLGCDSVASIVVDVHCKWSEWWGIAVCLAFEPINMRVSSPSDLRPGSKGSEEMCFYYWACKAPNREPDLGFPIGPKFGHLVYESNDPYIHIIFLTREHRYIEHYLDGEQSQLELIFYVENLSKPRKPTIRKCGCRVICEEDVQNWRNGSSGELDVEEPISPNAHLLV